MILLLSSLLSLLTSTGVQAFFSQSCRSSLEMLSLASSPSSSIALVTVIFITEYCSGSLSQYASSGIVSAMDCSLSLRAVLSYASSSESSSICLSIWITVLDALWLCSSPISSIRLLVLGMPPPLLPVVSPLVPGVAPLVAGVYPVMSFLVTSRSVSDGLILSSKVAASVLS